MQTKIEKIIYEGWGLGKEENSDRKVFVKKTVPEDIVKYKIVKEKPNLVEAEISNIISPSPMRVEPSCPFFNKCGGCDHQNISYDSQLQIKEKVFFETLERARIKITPEPILAGSSDQFYYRNVMRFFLDIDKNGQLKSYMHHFNYQKGLVEIDQCQLLSEESNKILSVFLNFVNQNIEDKSSFWQLRIRHAKETDQYMVDIMTTQSLPEEHSIIRVLLKNFEKIASIYHSQSETKNLKKLKRRLIFGSPVIQEKIGYFTFQISPESFFQTNSKGVKNLYETIKKIADVKIGESLLDLYCGTGTIGIYLSTMAKEVTGVEIVQSAINDANDNAKINHVKNCRFLCSDSHEYLRQTNQYFDVIIVDPPRSGLDKLLINRLSLINFGRLIYVSCNPATFARDINLLHDKRIELKKVQPVDMFPQTHHIECVGLLTK